MKVRTAFDCLREEDRWTEEAIRQQQIRSNAKLAVKQAVKDGRLEKPAIRAEVPARGG